MNQIIQEILRPLLRDLFLVRKAYVVVAILLLALFTFIGVIWPGRYSSTVTVFVEQRNILGPLMEGAAVQTDIRDEIGLARELIFGRKVLTTIATEHNLINDRMSPAEVDQIFEEIQDRTSLDLVEENLIEIEYSDIDPDRTYSVAKRFAQLCIDESNASKIQESQAAFEFIDKRANEYNSRLLEISDEIKEFRGQNQTVVPGAEAEVRARIQALSNQIEVQRQQRREAEVKASSLRSQLSGERQTAVIAIESDQIQQRIATLQARLDTLQLSYHDKYPDIVALKEQIEELKLQAQKEGVVVAGDSNRGDNRAGQAPVINVVGQQLRQELYNTDTLIATLNARLADTQRMLDIENDRISRIPEVEATLAELNREREVNLTLYNDLIRRREYARVSMNVDQENQGLALRIHEPANYPTNTSGPRLIHFVAFGLFFAFGAPLGAIVVKQQMDQRIRTDDSLRSVEQALPAFVGIPHLATPRESKRVHIEYWLLASFIVLGIGGSVGVGFLRLMDVL